MTHFNVFEVLKHRFPLDIKKLMESKTQACFVAPDGEVYRPYYFPKDPDNMYLIIRYQSSFPTVK